MISVWNCCNGPSLHQQSTSVCLSSHDFPILLCLSILAAARRSSGPGAGAICRAADGYLFIHPRVIREAGGWGCHCHRGRQWEGAAKERGLIVGKELLGLLSVGTSCYREGIKSPD